MVVKRRAGTGGGERWEHPQNAGSDGSRGPFQNPIDEVFVFPISNWRL